MRRSRGCVAKVRGILLLPCVIACIAFLQNVFPQQQSPAGPHHTPRAFEERFPVFKRVDHFENYSILQGMTDNVCRSNLLIDSEGYLWSGTLDGLNKFDGYTFETFRNNPLDTTSLSGNIVWSVCEDHNGDIWVGTFSAGLNRYSKSEHRFHRFFHDMNDSTTLSDNTITRILEDRQKNLWVGTINGWNRLSLSPPNLTRAHFVRYEASPDTLQKSRLVMAINEEPGGTVLVQTLHSGKVIWYRCNPLNNEVSALESFPGVPPAVLSKGILLPSELRQHVS